MLLKTKSDLSSLYVCFILTLPVQQMYNYQALCKKVCHKEVKFQKLLKYKPYKSNLSSLASEFLQRIQIQEFIFLGGGIGVRRMGGRWWWGGGEQKCKITNMSHHRIHIHKHTVFVKIYISTEKDH